MTENHNSEVRWETPVSDARSLAMVSLIDQDGLHITVQDLRDQERRRFRISFQRVPAYRNVLEEYRTSEPMPAERLGWTRLDASSAWLAELRRREPLLDVHTPGCRHYIICTEDDVIDVLSPEAPEIREIDPGSSEESPPGKSRVLYHSEDRGQIRQLIDRILGTDSDA